MKALKFQPELAQMIKDGTKTATWRINDDKDLHVGDVVELIDQADRKVFARAILTGVVEKPLGRLTEADKVGHEPFSSDREMYATFTRYYGPGIGPHTLVKIIRFELKSD